MRVLNRLLHHNASIIGSSSGGQPVPPVDTRKAVTGFSADNYLIANQAVWPGQEPFIVSIWGYLDNPPNGQCSAYFLGQNGITNNWRRLFYQQEATVNALRTVSRTTTNGAADIVNLAPIGSWFHWMGAFVTSNLRENWLNGGNKAQDTDSIDVTVAPTDTLIGVHSNVNARSPWVGALANLSVWDAASADASTRDCLASLLSFGINPNAINQSSNFWAGKLSTYSALNFTDLSTLSPFNQQGQLSAFNNYPPVNPEPTP